MFKYKPRTAMQLCLRLLDYAIESDAHKEVLSVLGRGINAAGARIHRAENSDVDDYVEAVTDSEIENIEGLLGAAYVVCQTQITTIVQAARRCRAHAVEDGRAFTAFGDSDHEVRRIGPRFDAQYSKVEVLWALANYFKHRDEWSSNSWTSPQGRERHTISAISAAGLGPGSNGNLRTGAEALGNPGYADMTVFQTIIREWADQVRTALQQAARLEP
jgi:hypothetical protein